MIDAPDYLVDEDLEVVWVRDDLAADEDDAVRLAVEWSEWEEHPDINIDEQYLSDDGDDLWEPADEHQVGAVRYWRLDWTE